MHLVRKEFSVTSIEKFWRDMVEGECTYCDVKNSMQTGKWKENERIALRYLETVISTFPTSLSSGAWLGCGTK